MADAPLLVTLRRVIKELDGIGAEFALVGGLGLLAWLPPRATADIDLERSCRGGHPHAALL